MKSSEFLQELFEHEPFYVCDAVRILSHHSPLLPLASCIGISGIEESAQLKKVVDRILPAGGENVQVKVYSPKGRQLAFCSLQALAKEDIRDFPVDLIIVQEHPTSSFDGFVDMVARLRAPDGCPWDKEQTHQSLRSNLLEETYEVLDAIDRDDMAALREELGDLLLQIVLHSQISSEKGEFTIEHVVQGIGDKIVNRHPHVFADLEVSGVDEVLRNWEKIKDQERKSDANTAHKGILDGVPLSLPSLARAQEIQDRAARVNFDWREIAPVEIKVEEELNEVRHADNHREKAKELGDLLFAVVNLVRWNKLDAESLLREANQKFIDRFHFIEKQARANGRKITDMSFEEMDALWDEAKKRGIGR